MFKMDNTISNIIHKGDAAFIVCYNCKHCDPISYDCKEDIKYYEWKKDGENIVTFVCSSFKQNDS